MDIQVQPVDNGWLVTSKTAGTRKVFTDREAMMEHLNDIVPPSGEGQDFIDAIDDEGDCDEDWDEVPQKGVFKIYFKNMKNMKEMTKYGTKRLH